MLIVRLPVNEQRLCEWLLLFGNLMPKIPKAEREKLFSFLWLETGDCKKYGANASSLPAWIQLAPFLRCYMTPVDLGKDQRWNHKAFYWMLLI